MLEQPTEALLAEYPAIIADRVWFECHIAFALMRAMAVVKMNIR